MKAIISECGNGHDWLEKYCSLCTRRPTSSNTSRCTASSTDSPASKKPASGVKRLVGEALCMASSTESPLRINTIMAGEMRG